MKRGLGLAMYAYAAFAPQAAHAQAVAPPECAAVYDTTLGETGVPSPELEAAIANYAEADVAAHVQILKHPEDAGIQVPDPDKNDKDEKATAHEQAEDYAKSLIARCDWDDDQTVVFVIAVGGKDEEGVQRGEYTIWRTEDAKNNLEESEIKDAEGGFVDAFHDPETSYQRDVAVFMEDIDPTEADKTMETVLVIGAIVVVVVVLYAAYRAGGLSGGSSSSSSDSYFGGSAFGGGFSSGGGGGGVSGSM